MPVVAFADVVEAVILGRRAFNALRSEDARVLDGIAAMAHPVAGEAGGRARGVVLLETIAPEHLTTDTENKLALLARELAHALVARGTTDLIEAANADGEIVVNDSQRSEMADEEPGMPKRMGLFQRFGRA